MEGGQQVSDNRIAGGRTFVAGKRNLLLTGSRGAGIVPPPLALGEQARAGVAVLTVTGADGLRCRPKSLGRA
jgi:hypothetical protein